MRLLVTMLSVPVLLLSLSVLPTEAARASFAAAERAFLEGRYDTAVNEADTLINSNTGQKDELYYLKGVSQLKLNKFNDARISFDYIIRRHPWSRRIFDAYLGKGDSYFLEGNAGDALGVYNEMVSKFQGDKNLVIVNQRIAACYNKLGLKDKAAAAAARAKAEAPMSFEAKAVPQMSAGPSVAAAPAVVRPPDAAPAKGVVASGGEQFSVQVGVFKNKRNADRLARNLSKAGFEARVEIPVAAQDKLYRVKVGRLTTRADAEDLASRLAKAGYKTRICSSEACD